jgi:hypothetical protein
MVEAIQEGLNERMLDKENNVEEEPETENVENDEETKSESREEARPRRPRRKTPTANNQ